MAVGRGALVASVGAVVFLAVAGLTGYGALVDDQDCPQPKDLKLPPRGNLFAKPGQIGVNGQLCIAWRPKSYFKSEVELRARQEEAVERAEAAQEAAAEAADAAAKSRSDDLANAQSTLRSVEANREQAEAKLDELPRSADVALFIDNKPTGITFSAPIPATRAPDSLVPEEIQLRGPENYISENAEVWRGFLRGVNRQGSRYVTVGLGDPGEKMPRAGFVVDKVPFGAFNPWALLLGVWGFITAMAGIVMLGWRTAMLRSHAPSAVNSNPPFSLARVQMAWWFMLTVAGFLFIWLTTGQWMGVMTPAVVALLGISGVSGLTAAAIDTNTVERRPATAVSKDFFTDILSDGDSIVLHRLQMFVWTLLLGLAFIWSVVWSYSFPAFDPTLLVLAGVVNGVYVGFKFPENKQAADEGFKLPEDKQPAAEEKKEPGQHS